MTFFHTLHVHYNLCVLSVLHIIYFLVTYILFLILDLFDINHILEIQVELLARWPVGRWPVGPLA